MRCCGGLGGRAPGLCRLLTLHSLLPGPPYRARRRGPGAGSQIRRTMWEDDEAPQSESWPNYRRGTAPLRAAATAPPAVATGRSRGAAGDVALAMRRRLWTVANLLLPVPVGHPLFCCCSSAVERQMLSWTALQLGNVAEASGGSLKCFSDSCRCLLGTDYANLVVAASGSAEAARERRHAETRPSALSPLASLSSTSSPLSLFSSSAVSVTSSEPLPPLPAAVGSNPGGGCVYSLGCFQLGCCAGLQRSRFLRRFYRISAGPPRPGFRPGARRPRYTNYDAATPAVISPLHWRHTRNNSYGLCDELKNDRHVSSTVVASDSRLLRRLARPGTARHRNVATAHVLLPRRPHACYTAKRTRLQDALAGPGACQSDMRLLRANFAPICPSNSWVTKGACLISGEGNDNESTAASSGVRRCCASAPRKTSSLAAAVNKRQITSSSTAMAGGAHRPASWEGPRNSQREAQDGRQRYHNMAAAGVPVSSEACQSTRGGKLKLPAASVGQATQLQKGCAAHLFCGKPKLQESILCPTNQFDNSCCNRLIPSPAFRSTNRLRRSRVWDLLVHGFGSRFRKPFQNSSPLKTRALRKALQAGLNTKACPQQRPNFYTCERLLGIVPAPLDQPYQRSTHCAPEKSRHTCSYSRIKAASRQPAKYVFPMARFQRRSRQLVVEPSPRTTRFPSSSTSCDQSTGNSTELDMTPKATNWAVERVVTEGSAVATTITTAWAEATTNSQQPGLQATVSQTQETGRRRHTELSDPAHSRTTPRWRPRNFTPPHGDVPHSLLRQTMSSCGAPLGEARRTNRPVRSPNLKGAARDGYRGRCQTRNNVTGRQQERRLPGKLGATRSYSRSQLKYPCDLNLKRGSQRSLRCGFGVPDPFPIANTFSATDPIKKKRRFRNQQVPKRRFPRGTRPRLLPLVADFSLGPSGLLSRSSLNPTLCSQRFTGTQSPMHHQKTLTSSSSSFCGTTTDGALEQRVGAAGSRRVRASAPQPRQGEPALRRMSRRWIDEVGAKEFASANTGVPASSESSQRATVLECSSAASTVSRKRSSATTGRLIAEAENSWSQRRFSSVAGGPARWYDDVDEHVSREMERPSPAGSALGWKFTAVGEVSKHRVQQPRLGLCYTPVQRPICRPSSEEKPPVNEVGFDQLLELKSRGAALIAWRHWWNTAIQKNSVHAVSDDAIHADAPCCQDCVAGRGNTLPNGDECVWIEGSFGCTATNCRGECSSNEERRSVPLPQ